MHHEMTTALTLRRNGLVMCLVAALLGLAASASAQGLTATITYPADGATNADPLQPIQWTNVSGAQAYVIWVGTSIGANNVVNSPQLAGTSYQAASLPPNQLLYARMWTEVGGVWRSVDSTFTEQSLTATLTAPVDGATQVNLLQPLQWASVPNAQGYVVWIGTTSGAKNLLETSRLSADLLSAIEPARQSDALCPAGPRGERLACVDARSRENADGHADHPAPATGVSPRRPHNGRPSRTAGLCAVARHARAGGPTRTLGHVVSTFNAAGQHHAARMWTEVGGLARGQRVHDRATGHADQPGRRRGQRQRRGARALDERARRPGVRIVGRHVERRAGRCRERRNPGDVLSSDLSGEHHAVRADVDGSRRRLALGGQHVHYRADRDADQPGGRCDQRGRRASGAVDERDRCPGLRPLGRNHARRERSVRHRRTAYHVLPAVGAAPASRPSTRMWTEAGGVWRFVDSAFTTAGVATLTSPADGTVGFDVTHAMQWTAVSGAQAYELWVGTTAGTHDVFDSSQLHVTSYQPQAGILPANQTLYARMWTEVGGVWRFNDSTFTAASLTSTLTTPANGAANFDPLQSMQWTSVTSAQAYVVWIGTTAGASDVISTLPASSDFVRDRRLPRRPPTRGCGPKWAACGAIPIRRSAPPRSEPP